MVLLSCRVWFTLQTETGFLIMHKPALPMEGTDTYNDRIRIVLVETSHSGNIGAVARAMKNMGLGNLWLVNPKSFPDEASYARAAGASDVLDRAQVVANLEEAIAFIEDIQPREAYFTHISHHMGQHADIQPQLPQGVFLASDGLTLNIRP